MNTITAKSTHQDFLMAIEQRVAAEPLGQLCKLDLSRDGSLLAQLQFGSDQLWVRWSNGVAEDLLPSRDPKIPLATILGNGNKPDHLRILNYRPGRRLVLLDTSGRQPLVIKGFRKRKVQKVFNKYESARAALAGRGIHAPEVRSVNEGLACLVMVYENGEPLQLSADAMYLHQLIGENLQNFQDRATTIDLEIFNSQDELAVIDKLVNSLGRMGIELPDQWSTLRMRLQSIGKELPPAEIGQCHRDLYDKQFIRYRNDITLLDFDLMCRADVALDPANFLAHMVLRKLQGARGATQKSIEICGKHFLQGLNRTAEPDFRKKLHFFQATSFCRLSLVYSLRPPWVGIVPDLVRMGHRCLDDLQQPQSS